MGDVELLVVENTDDAHNMIVCTLCSCYPRTILGMPPDWYKSKTYRSRAVNEPRAVLKEFGTELADDVTVRVHDSNADMRYLDQIYEFTVRVPDLDLEDSQLKEQ